MSSRTHDVEVLQHFKIQKTYYPESIGQSSKAGTATQSSTLALPLSTGKPVCREQPTGNIALLITTQPLMQAARLFSQSTLSTTLREKEPSRHKPEHHRWPQYG